MTAKSSFSSSFSRSHFSTGALVGLWMEEILSRATRMISRVCGFMLGRRLAGDELTVGAIGEKFIYSVAVTGA
jgi:hypothetical protein